VRGSIVALLSEGENVAVETGEIPVILSAMNHIVLLGFWLTTSRDT
jgi:hypothetical protein